MQIQSIKTYSDYIDFLEKYKYIIINISALWCKPCMTLKPDLEKFISVLDINDKDYIYLKLDESDYSENPEFNDLFNMQKIPYFAIVKNGILEESFVSGNFDFVSKKIFEYIKHEHLINSSDFKSDEDF